MTRRLRSVLLISRKKDNMEIEDFKERKQVSLWSDGSEKILEKLDKFTREGKDGEVSRLYVSADEIDENKLKKELIKYLVDHDDINYERMDSLLIKLFFKHKTLKTNKWVLDYDGNVDKIDEFLADLKEYYPDEISTFESLNGFNVVLEHGAYLKPLLKKWENVEVKKNGMIFIASSEVEIINENSKNNLRSKII